MSLLEARVTLPIRWRDLDLLGHLNQAVYHEFLEEGRSALFDRVAFGEGFSFVLARVELDYRSEVRRDHGSVEVVARVARIGTSSITVENDVVLPDGTVAATGTSVLVAWDARARTKRALSDEEKTALGHPEATAVTKS